MLVAIGVGLSLWTIRAAGAFGVSRLLVKYAVATRDLGVAQRATQLTPEDAQAHFANAAVLSSLNRPAESVVKLERALAVGRPTTRSGYSWDFFGTSWAKQKQRSQRLMKRFALPPSMRGRAGYAATSS
jgi:hypothetical protein